MAQHAPKDHPVRPSSSIASHVTPAWMHPRFLRRVSAVHQQIEVADRHLGVERTGNDV